MGATFHVESKNDVSFLLDFNFDLEITMKGISTQNQGLSKKLTSFLDSGKMLPAGA